MTATETQNVGLDPQFLKSLDPALAGAAASKLFAASVSDIVVVLSRSPAMSVIHLPISNERRRPGGGGAVLFGGGEAHLVPLPETFSGRPIIDCMGVGRDCCSIDIAITKWHD
jgi:hypothetical protein